MTAVIPLRTAAVISVLFTAGHTMGGLKNWSPMVDNDVLRQMRAFHFETMGVSRSYLDFYTGFGWSISVAMALQTVILWQLASVARADGALARPMIAAFILAMLAGGTIAWFFIFPVPAVFSGALLVVLIWAYIRAR